MTKDTPFLGREFSALLFRTLSTAAVGTSLAVPFFGCLQAAEFHVAPNGSDTNTGNRQSPFATIERAQAAARSACQRESVTVLVHSGAYRLKSPLRFTREDSAAMGLVTYKAHKMETPVLSGGQPVTNFLPHSGKVLKTELGPQGITNNIQDVFWDRKRIELARFPNVDPAKPFTSGWAFVAASPALPDPKRMFRLGEKDVRNWSRPTDAVISIFPSHEWWNDLIAVTNLDTSERIVSLRDNCSWPITPGDRFFIQGLFEELDAPGEWYYDSLKGVLYIWPPEDAASGEVCVSQTANLLEVGPGARNLRFEGITFEAAQSSAIQLTDCTNVVISGCVIRNIGGFASTGVVISGGLSNGIVSCDISDTDGNGVLVSGGNQDTLTPACNFVENNRITRTGRLYKQGSGVVLAGVGNRVSRNTIYDLPRFGILFNGQNNVIELNHIHHVSQETMDTGAIYGLSFNWLQAHGTIIRNNFVHDVLGASGKAGKWQSPYYAWGIYLDWTAMGVTVSGNVVARCPRAGIHVHDGRDNLVENNILVDCGAGPSEEAVTSQIEFSGWDTTYGWWKDEFPNWCKQYDSVKDLPAWRGVGSLQDPRTVPLPDGKTMRRNVVRRNILYWSDPNAQAFSFRNLAFSENHSDSNLVWHLGMPIRTGQHKASQVAQVRTPFNADFEQGSEKNIPDGWFWVLRPSTNDTAEFSTNALAGHGCLVLTGRKDPANSAIEEWHRIPCVACKEIPLAHGKVYRLSAWMRSDASGARAELALQSWRENAWNWFFSEAFRVDTQWRRYELITRLPEKPLEMKTCYARIALPSQEGSLYVDNLAIEEVTLENEWTTWQSLGYDTHSLIADPLFVNAKKDDYRLKKGSPAEKIGFKPIPFAKIGAASSSSR